MDTAEKIPDDALDDMIALTAAELRPILERVFYVDKVDPQLALAALMAHVRTAINDPGETVKSRAETFAAVATIALRQLLTAERDRG